MNATYPRDLRLKFPAHWEVAWEVIDGELVEEEEIRQFFKTNRINWDEPFTSAFNGPKASVGIEMTPEAENHSDHDDDYRLKRFPEELIDGPHHERWGFTKHGKLIGAPKAASSASSSTKAVKKKKKIRKNMR